MNKYRIVEKTNMEFNWGSGPDYIEVTKYYVEEKHWFLGWCKICYYYSEQAAREKIQSLQYISKERIITI